MSCYAALLCLLSLLLTASWSTAVTKDSLPCLYTRSEELLIFECAQPPKSTTADSVELPSKTRIERQLDELAVPNTTIRLANATRVRPEPPPPLNDLPVEIKRCGLAKLGRLLNETSAGSGGLMLNFSAISLRLGGHGDFDGLSTDQPTWLDLSHNRINSLPPGVFDSLPNLVALNLAWNSIEHLENDAFCSAPAATLRWLDLRGNPMLTTYALPPLSALQWLDANLTVLHVGSFCRMARLSRVTLHQPVTLLRCFVFDSLPSLTELSLAYHVGAKNVCLTMMCDPHPALNGSRVPFNFSIATVSRSNGAVESKKEFRNFFIRKDLLTNIYGRLCQFNYDHYWSYHNRGMPATQGCLTAETDSPVCSKIISPPSVCSEPTTSTATTTLSTITTPIVYDVETLKIDSTSVPFSTGVQEASEIMSTLTTVIDRAVSMDFDNRPSVLQAKAVREALRRQKIRSNELEKEIARLEQIIIVVYSISAVLLFILASIAVRCTVARYRRSCRRRSSFWRQHGQDLLGPEQHPLQQTNTQAAAAAAAAATTTTVPAVLTTTAIFFANSEEKSTATTSDPNNDYVPMRDPMYPRLPGEFPNPFYGRTGTA